MSKAPKTKVTRTSICNCEQVEISVTGIDKGAAACHCDNCRRSTGTVFAHNHRFMEAELQVKKGGDKIKEFPDKRTKSGETLFRHFCSECGSNLYLNTSGVKGLILLNAGSIQGERVQPTVEMFGEDKYLWLGNVKAERAKM